MEIKEIVNPNNPEPIEAIAYWALEQPEDDIGVITTSIKSSTKLTSKQLKEVKRILQKIDELQNSSSTFPKPDLPRLENFKFSEMPDGSIYVEEKIPDKFNGLKVSEMPDGSFYVELSD